MFENILVPTDGSALAIGLVSQAVKFAKRLGAKVTFFHYSEAISGLGDAALMYALAPSIHAEKYAWRQKAVLWKAEAEALAMGVPFASVTGSRGGVAEAILQAATQQHCDLIFIASHGRSSVLKMMLGSVTLKVLMNAPISVQVWQTGKQALSTMERAINTLREEHRSLSAVLRGLTYLLERARATDQLPDMAVMRAILSYVREFSQELHHPKEEDYLFRKLRNKTGEFDVQLATLCEQHTQEPVLIAVLEAALNDADQSGSKDLGALQQAADALVSHVRKHMGLEEALLMPAACRLLTEVDWQEIVKAFQENGDPRFGAQSDEEFRLLFGRIVSLFPSAQELA
jgi:hemerythrin-like domain-containing protein/nucleotide-binding universal stress UspA family protein